VGPPHSQLKLTSMGSELLTRSAAEHRSCDILSLSTIDNQSHILKMAANPPPSATYVSLHSDTYLALANIFLGSTRATSKNV
jgi:hypothetical protein